nr:putative transposase (putative), gypsy type [Tanacetum cinerariifolium]
MDLLSFIRTADPTKVRIGERERDEGEPKLLEATVRRVVLLLPVALDHSSGELEASVDKLFDEGGSDEQADQGDSAGGGHGTKVVDAGEPSHLAKKLRGDYEASGVPAVGDSFDPSGVNIVEAEVDYVVRTFVSIMTNATTATPTDDPATIAREKLVSASVFGGDSSSVGGSHPISGGFSDRTGGDFLVGGIRTVVDPDSNLQRVYVPHWNVTNGFYMDDGGVCREMVDEFALPEFFTSIRGMEHDQLFTEFNVRATRQISLGAEVRMRAEYNIKEKRRLKSVVEEKDLLLKSRCDEIESLKAQLLIKEAEAAEAVRLCDETQTLKERNIILEKEKKRLEEFQDAQLKVVNDKLEKLYADFVDMALHLEEKFYPHLLTIIFVRRWIVTHGMELAITKCLHSSEYLSTLGAAIGKATEKGMQDGLAAENTHGAEGRTLADVAAYNPFAEANYFFALQRFQNINFSLLAELRSSKDDSVDTTMNILLLEDDLAKRFGLTESQPCVDQLMVPIHHLSDRVVVVATSLSFSLDVSDARVRKIRENIASQRPAMSDVFTPISEPFSTEVLTGTGGNSDTVHAPITMALSVTTISASTISSISTDGYEIAHTEGGEDVVADVEAVADEGVDPFPDVSGVKLDISEWLFDSYRDIPCLRKGVSIAVSKPVRSFAQCFRDFVWSLPLRSELVPVFRMACFVVPVDIVSWTKACVSDPGIVISFHFGFAPCFLYCSLFSLFLQEIQADSQGFVILDNINFRRQFCGTAESIPCILLVAKEVHQRSCKTSPHKANGGESTEAFMDRFKAKSLHVKGAPECLRIFGFMH